MNLCKHGHDKDALGARPDGGCQECERIRNRKRYAERVAKLRAYKLARGCQRCGYAKVASALQFHHRDPSTKKIKLSSNSGGGRGRHGPTAIHSAWDRVVAEMEKCDVLCANCHAEEHADG